MELHRALVPPAETRTEARFLCSRHLLLPVAEKTLLCLRRRWSVQFAMLLLQSLLLKAQEITQQDNTEETSALTYVAAGIIAAVGIAYYYMSAPVGAPAGHGHGGPSAASSAPVRVSEGTPDANRTFTLAQLKQYDGSNPTGPIYIGTGGLVFDVTGGASFYGPGGPYASFAGTDASRGLAKMDLKSSSFGVDDLTASEKNTLREWKEKYEAKYPVVGKIVDYSQPNSGPAPPNGEYTGAAQ